MTSITTKPDSSRPAAEATADLFDNWFDPIETGVRERVREFPCGNDQQRDPNGGVVRCYAQDDTWLHK
jgi:hypothetical protein